MDYIYCEQFGEVASSVCENNFSPHNVACKKCPHNKTIAKGKKPTDKTSHDFRFNRTQVAELKNILLEYDSSQVDKFLFELQSLCRQRLHLKPFNELKDHRQWLDKKRNELEDVCKTLRSMSGKKFNLIPQNIFADMYGEDVAQLIDMNFGLVDKAAAAHDSLNDILEMIARAKDVLESRKPLNRPTSVSDGFANEAALVFAKHLRIPTAFPEGAFARVVTLALEAMENYKPKNLRKEISTPRRGIETAVQKIKTPKNI